MTGTSSSTRWNGHQRRRLTSELICVPLGREPVIETATSRGSREFTRQINILNGEWFSLSVTPRYMDDDHIIASVRIINWTSGGDLQFDAEVLRHPLANNGFSWYTYCAGDSTEPHRVKDLYVDFANQRIACRECHDLAYASELHDKALDRVKKTLKVDPALAAEELETLFADRIRKTEDILQRMDQTKAVSAAMARTKTSAIFRGSLFGRR